MKNNFPQPSSLILVHILLDCLGRGSTADFPQPSLILVDQLLDFIANPCLSMNSMLMKGIFSHVLFVKASIFLSIITPPQSLSGELGENLLITESEAPVAFSTQEQ